MLPYRLDELGWLQFDRLCPLVLEAQTGLARLSWRGRSDTARVATVEDRVVLPDQGVRLDGPATVAAFWIRDDRSRAKRLSVFATRTAALCEEPSALLEDDLVVVTNLDAGDALAVLRSQACVKDRHLAVIGAGEIAASLDRHPALRAALPSVLGLRDLGPLIDPDVRARSSLDVESAQDLARVFWPTRAYERARPAPLKAGLRRVQREHGAERFPAPGEVLVDASNLDLEEKTLILFRHAKAGGASGQSRKLLRWSALSIVEHPHFTPERIRRFVSDRLPELPGLAADRDALMLLAKRELASPTEAMRNSFRALSREHRDLLIALLDEPAGLIDERELAATVRRHHAGGLSRPPAELIDRLTDHFLRVTPLGIGLVHPSWRDLVIDELRDDPAARLRFLGSCGVHGVTLALSLQGGAGGERSLPLLANDRDWDQLGDRLSMILRELEDQELARVLLALGAALAQAGEPVQQLERPDRAELVRAEEWLALARVLSRHDPKALRRLGFPDRDRGLLEQLIVTLARTTAADEELRPLAQAVLSRIEELIPDLASGAHSAIEIVRLVEQLERKRWWTPHDIGVPPSTEPVATSAIEFNRDDVKRVLEDL